MSPIDWLSEHRTGGPAASEYSLLQLSDNQLYSPRSYACFSDFRVGKVKKFVTITCNTRGEMRWAYLKEYHHARYMGLLLTGELWTYLADLNEQAEERMETIVRQMMETEGVTEELKSREQMEWIRKCNSIRNRAEEIICAELIYDSLT